jgi:CRISPR type II-A-associated protein Csn2
MKLNHRLVEHDLLLENQPAGVVVVEKPGFLPEMARELALQLEGEDGAFVLSEKFKEAAIAKCLSLDVSPLNLEHNPRRAITALYKQLGKHLAESEVSFEVQDLFTQLRQKLTAALMEAEVELEELETPEWDSILKFYDVKFRSQYASLEEEVCDYCKMANRYLGTRVFVFVHSLHFFSKTGLAEIVKQLTYDGLQILFLESRVVEEDRYIGLRTLIVDGDLCEIEWN